MAVFTDDFEAGTVGNTVTGSWTAAAGFTYQTAGGSKVARAAAPGTANATLRLALASVSKVKFRGYFTITANNAADLHLVKPHHTNAGQTDANACTIYLNTAQKIRLSTAGSGATTTRWTATNTTATGTKYRLEVYAEAGTTASNGAVRVTVFTGDSSTADDDSTLITGIDVAGVSGAFVNLRVGKLDGGNYTGTIDWDNVKITTDADAVNAADPAANVPPTVNAGVDQNVAAGATVNLSASASDADGTIVSHAWTFDYPTSGAPTLTGAATVTPSFTAGAGGSLYVLRDTVTDNGGATASDTVEVRVESTGNQVPLPVAATTTGTVTRTGGTTDGGALSDGSDATFMTISQGGSLLIRVVPITSRTGMTYTFRLSSPDSGLAKVSLLQGTSIEIQASTNLTLTSGAANYSLPITNWGAVTDRNNLYAKIEAI